MQFERKVYIAGFILALFCILMTYSLCYSSWQKSLMNGFWEIDDDFAEEAGLDSMYIYIDGNSWYIFAQRGEQSIINDPTKVRISGDSILFENIDNPAFPKKQKIKHTAEKLILYKDDTIYGILFKNAVMTDQGKN